MIINKDTSDAALVNSLVIKGSGGPFLTNVEEFDTSTLEATFVGGGTETAQWFWFDPADETVHETLEGLVPAESLELARIQAPNYSPGHKAMVSADTSPTHHHQILGPAVPLLVQCSNCSTMFVVYRTDDGKIYETERANAADKHLTATEIVDPGTYTCDNCSETVALVG